MKKITLLIIFLIFCIIIGRCAKQMAPGGGPLDKIPPKILNVFPTPDSTRLALDTNVMLEFSEKMEKKTVEQAIFISPRQEKNVKFKWKGKKIYIKFADSLKINKTYILTVGADAQDLRRNKLKESFHLAFSTGVELDEGKISGQVFSESNTAGTIVGAYSLDSNSEPDPSEQYAEYITQCDEKGKYQLSYISAAKYRLFAILDKDGDQKYQHGIEAIGIPTSDIIITKDSLHIENINFKLAIKDTILPEVRSAIDIDQNHVDIRFSENMSSIKNKNFNDIFSIIDEESKSDTLKIKDCYQNSVDASRFHFKTETQPPEKQYIITVHNFYDLSNNPIDTSYNTTSFMGSSKPDSLKPSLTSHSLEKSVKDVALDIQIKFNFSEALVCSTFEQSFNMADSNKTNISGNFNWENPADVTFTPSENLTSKMKYHVFVKVDSVIDEFGNSLADSAIDFKFTTLNIDTLCEISGQIIDKIDDEKGKIYLTARQIGKQDIFYDIVLDSVGTYLFEGILPGSYHIQGFKDSDNDGKYNYGKILPYQAAERFIYYPDSVTIKSRWSNDGNDIIFNKH